MAKSQFQEHIIIHLERKELNTTVNLKEDKDKRC